MRIASFPARSVRLDFGREFPGAKGSISYSNDVLRLDYDFTQGGAYLALGVGSLAEGSRQIRGDFRCLGRSDFHVGFRVRDAKGDFYVLGRDIRGSDGWVTCKFDVSELKWGWGASKTVDARNKIKWPVSAVFTCSSRGERKDRIGRLEVRNVCVTTAGEVACDWHFAADPLPFGALYYPGDSVRLRYRLQNLNLDGRAAGVSLDRAVVTDWRGNEVCVRKLEDAGELVLTEKDLANRYGAFQIVVLGRTADGAEREMKRLRFARLTSKEVQPCSWVGTGTHSTHGWGWGDYRLVDLIAAAGIGIVRDEPSWAACERKKGEYAIPKKFENYLDSLHARGVKMNLALGYVNKIYEDPLDHEAFAKFCGWIAGYFKGRVDRYEIWNEPHNFYVRKHYHKKGVPEVEWVKKFIELTHKADDAIRDAHPEAVVAVASEDWDRYLYKMLTNGIARAHNAVSFHPYCHWQPRPEREMFLCDFGAKARGFAKAHGGADRWCITEAGWTTFAGKGKFWEVAGFYPRASLDGQAAYIVRMYLAAKESGCEYACQYDFRDDGTHRESAEHNFGLVTVDYAPKPSFAAVAFLTRLLGPAEFVQEISADPAKYRVAKFRRDGKSVYAMWSIEGSMKIDLPKDVRGGFVFDLMGNRSQLGNTDSFQLSETPVYVVGPTFMTPTDVRPTH